MFSDEAILIPVVTCSFGFTERVGTTSVVLGDG